LRRVGDVEANLSPRIQILYKGSVRGKDDFAAKPASLPLWKINLCNCPGVCQSSGELVDVLVLGQVVCIVTWDQQVVNFLPFLIVFGNTVKVKTIVTPNLNAGGPVWSISFTKIISVGQVQVSITLSK
jgi:hypothetical protein